MPWLGIAVPWTLFVLTLHAVGSTTVPIVMAELCTPARRTTPWLGRAGLVVTAVLFVLGIAVNTAFQMAQRPVPGRARAVRRRRRCSRRWPRWSRCGSPAAPGLPGGVPAPWVVGLGRAGGRRGCWRLAPWSWAGVALVVVVEVGLAAARGPVGGARGLDTAPHPAAAAAGLLTYAWHAFPETPVVPVAAAVDLIGNAVFALGALLLIGMAWRRTAAASTIDISSLTAEHWPSPAQRSRTVRIADILETKGRTVHSSASGRRSPMSSPSSAGHGWARCWCSTRTTRSRASSPSATSCWRSAATARRTLSLEVTEVMTRQVRTCTSDELVAEAMATMTAAATATCPWWTTGRWSAWSASATW